MPHDKNNRSELYIRWTLAVLALALAILLVVVAVQYRSLRRAQILNARQAQWSLILKSHAPLAGESASVIHSWMTFDYINKLFALPPDYLKTQLQISDTHYPRLTISGYVKTDKLDATTFLDQVENAVRAYGTSTNETSTSAGAGTLST